MKICAHYILLFAVCCSIYSCKEDTAISTTVIDRITQTSVIFDDASIKPLNAEGKKMKQVFYLVRHAEKDTVKKEDPMLTAEGERRAEELANIFKQTRIDEVYSTIYMRTLMTGEPVTKSKGLSIKPYDPKELKAFAEQLKNNESIQSALIIGHSNTTPKLVGFLADAELEKIDESDYDNLYIVVVHEDGTVNYNNYQFLIDYE